MGIKHVLNKEVLRVEGHPVFVGCGKDGATVNKFEQNGTYERKTSEKTNMVVFGMVLYYKLK